ncbi:MAG: protein phosphatase [Dactylosporangium sp.]|nr:protein phosphatase 2C domain-containing protein [Dactylosporangium sp.]NNJ61565.1 protein phosphatase [Dactylosporangium sp.]
MTLTLRYAARSDRGLIRGGNQDSVYAGPRLLAVADGMGGMAAGDVASNIVIACMAPLDEDVSDGAMIDALRNAVDLANQQIRYTVDANPAMEGMGTTLTGMLFSGARIGMVHIGDSRAYILRSDKFAQVTKDDTYVQMLVDEGRITPEEAGSHPQRSLLTRALDGRDVDPEYSMRSAEPGDRYLLCSDGLSSVVSADTIAATLREYADPKESAERLVQLALRGGGPDNITVIVADVTDQDIVEETPIVGGAASRDRGMATSADQSMSSARGAAFSSPRGPAPTEADQATDGEDGERSDAARAKRHPVRTALVFLALLGTLAGGLWYGWRYTQSQYYVGAAPDGAVVIYQGVPGRIAWLDLSTVYERSDLQLSDLTPVAQNNVKRGIPAEDRADAQRTLADLSDPDNPANRQHAQTCPSGSASPGAAEGSVDPTADPGTTTVPGPGGSGSLPAPDAGVETPGTEPGSAITDASSTKPC